MELDQKQRYILKDVKILLDRIYKNMTVDLNSGGSPNNIVKNWVSLSNFEYKYEADKLERYKRLKSAVDLIDSLANGRIVAEINEEIQDKPRENNEGANLESRDKTRQSESDILIAINQVKDELNKMGAEIQNQLRIFAEKQDVMSNLMAEFNTVKGSVQLQNIHTETKDESLKKEAQGQKQVQDTKKEVAEKSYVKLSDIAMQSMRKLVNTYNTNPKQRLKFKLTLLFDETNYRKNNGPNNESEIIARPAILQETGGNLIYFGQPVPEQEKEVFIVPTKQKRFNKTTVWSSAYGYFFDIENKESLLPQMMDNNLFSLIQPAIVEQRQDGNYYLLQRGKIKVES